MRDVKARAVVLLSVLCSLLTFARSTRADDLAPAASVGVELSVLDRVSNGTSKTGVILADYLTLGVAVGGSVELAESIRGFGEITPVFRLMDTRLGFFEGFRWDLGVAYEIDESLYARGAIRLHQNRTKIADTTYTSNSFGLDPRLGYRTEIDVDLFWFIEGGAPLLFLAKTKRLPEIILISGVEKKF